MSGISNILDEEFSKLRVRRPEVANVESAQEQAKFLNIPPSTLSRLRSGKTKVTSKRANSIAFSLRGDMSTESIENLKRQLIECNFSDTDNRKNQLVDGMLPRLMSRLTDSDSLLFVEYRDAPRTLDKPHFPQLELAGQSIAAGLNMALVQPFGRLTTINSDGQYEHLPEFLMFLCEVVTNVRGVYNITRELAAERYRSLNGGSRKAAFEVIDSRFVLYERNQSITDFVASGLQSRTLMAYVSQERKTEVWDWVDSDQGSLLIRRNTDHQIFYEKQYHPLTTYFFRSSVLPTSGTEKLEGKKILGANSAWAVFKPEKK